MHLSLEVDLARAWRLFLNNLLLFIYLIVQLDNHTPLLTTPLVIIVKILRFFLLRRLNCLFFRGRVDTLLVSCIVRFLNRLLLLLVAFGSSLNAFRVGITMGQRTNRLSRYLPFFGLAGLSRHPLFVLLPSSILLFKQNGQVLFPHP